MSPSFFGSSDKQGAGLYPIDRQARRIAAIREAAGKKSVDLFLNARTDLFLAEPSRVDDRFGNILLNLDARLNRVVQEILGVLQRQLELITVWKSRCSTRSLRIGC
jgi:Phosphoenolpyruvate phosphomutase